MKILKAGCLALLLVLSGLLAACQSTAPVGPRAQAATTELSQLSYLEMMNLDPGDHSQFADILLPQLDLSVRVKKADYRIAETGTEVKSQHFKITRVTRGDVPRHRPPGCAVVSWDSEEMRDFLFRTRFQHDYFDPVIVQHLCDAVREQAAKEGLSSTNILGGQQLIDIATLSPAANETWVLWEIRRKLFHISSDIDLADPAVWKYQTLRIRTFDLNQQVVISHREATGSNFYLTRYQVSRALFNCIVIGQRIDVPPRR